MYTLQSRDFYTFLAFDTSGANDQLINLIKNGVKSHVQKTIYRLDILFKTNSKIINITWYDGDISSRGSMIFRRAGKGGGWKMKWQGEVGVGFGWVKVKLLENVLSTFTLYTLMYKYNNQTKVLRYIYIVFILSLNWPCKIREVYTAPRFWRRVYYSEKKRCLGSNSKVCYW